MENFSVKETSIKKKLTDFNCWDDTTLLPPGKAYLFTTSTTHVYLL